MSITKRLFIGNIHHEVQDSDLKSRFSNFGTVHSVDVRSKNSDHFAFITMEFTDIHAVEKCVDVMNNTIWKGLTLRVQYAKENFLEKLKREREQVQGGDSRIYAEATTKMNTENGYERRPLHRNETSWRTDNFDFEIVPCEGNTKSIEHGKPSLLSLSPSKPNSHEKVYMTVKDPKSTIRTSEIAKHRTLESLSSDTPVAAKTCSPIQKFKLNVKKKKRRHSSSSSSSSGESSVDEKDGIPRFGGLAAYADLFCSAVASPEVELEAEHAEIKGTQLQLSKPSSTFAASASADYNASPEFKLKLNPRKKAKSDELRVKSLSAREEESIKRSNLIRSALSNVKLHPTIVQSTSSSRENESKDVLFATDADDDEETKVSFNVKPQYEGTLGQKMLKLKSTYGNDERFQLDQRFADKEEKEENSEQNFEKEAQLGILEEIIGPTAPIPKIKSASEFDIEELRSIRFDPTLPEHQKYILNRKPLENEGNEEKTKHSGDVSKKRKKKRKVEDEKLIEEEKLNLKDPDAKSTFKVAENLKTLFARNEATSFSILNSFGDGTRENETANQNYSKTSEHEKSEYGIRDVWKKNPFKYDSSDDDEEVTAKTKRKKASSGPSSSVSTKSEPLNNVKHDFFKKESLFFDPKDRRLTGIFQQFLSSTENAEEVNQKFNEVGRNELKAIARSKLKNSKRKIEKKVKITRLLRRKKKREALQKQQNYEKRRAVKSQ